MTILLIDAPNERARIKHQLEESQGEVGPLTFLELDHANDLAPVLRRPDLRLVVLEQRLPGTDGLSALAQVRQVRPELPVIMVAGSGDEELAVAALKAGLADYLPKRRLDRLPRAVRSALRSAAPTGALGRPRGEALLAAQNRILAMIARDCPLGEVLEALVRALEEVGPADVLASILLLDNTGRLRHGAAPSLPAAYNQLVDGLAIGPEVGSCGTAAYRAQLVIVTDISTNPLWRDARFVVAEYGLCACWSMPIVARSGKVLGTFAMYYRQPRAPSTEDVEQIQAAAALAAVAIENRQAEADLRARERRFRALVENAFDAVSLLGPDGTILYESAHGTLRGVRPGEPIGSYAFEWVHPDDIGLVLERFRELLARPEQSVCAQVRVSDGKGDWRSLEASARNLLGAPEVGAIVVNWRDITERKQAEEQLRQSEARIREQAGLLERARDAIVVLDLNDRITYWNRGAERLFGCSAAEAIGQDVRAVPGWGGLEQLGHRGERDESGEWRGEVRLVAGHGEERTVEISQTLVRDDEGRPRARLSIITDVTEKKQLEARFLRAQRLESIGTLAGGIAHDLNNVLTPVLVGVSSLRQAPPEEQQQAVLDAIETSARRGAELVRQVLEFARGHRGERRIFDVRPVLLSTQRLLEHSFPKSIQIDTCVPASLARVVGDATQLSQVLMNVCVNARDAMPNGGRLTIRAHSAVLDERAVRAYPEARAGPYVVISVTDTGTGMAAEVLDKIFDPFFTTKELGQGTGLGLATAQGLVRHHGGFIDVVSQIGQGSTFHIWLPATEQPVEPAHITSAEVPRGQQQGVLVVDDEEVIRKVVRATLEEAGYRVLSAADGAEALAVYARHRGEIDVVLMDLMMPVMDGPTAIQALRKIGPGVRIIAASGLTSPQDIGGEELGERAFLAKPYTKQQLLQTLARVVGETSGRR
jgi:PAS domain S-box-containing protein